MHPQSGVVVIRMAGMHRSNERDVIHLIRNLGKQIADLDATLPTRREFPVGSLQKDLLVTWPVTSLRMIERDLLAVIGDQLGLGVERIDVRNAAAHEQKDHRLGFGGKMGLFGGKRIGAIRVGNRRRTARVGGKQFAQQAGHQERPGDRRPHELSTISVIANVIHDVIPHKGTGCSKAGFAHRPTMRPMAGLPSEYRTSPPYTSSGRLLRFRVRLSSAVVAGQFGIAHPTD